LDEFKVHAEEKRLDKPSLMSYIDKESANLGSWNVLFKSNSLGNATKFNFGGDVGEVATIKRSRQPHASIAFVGSVIDPKDHRLDLNGLVPTDGSRYRAASEPPLLVLYTIDKISTPDTRGNRVALNAETEPLSISLVFPKSNSFVEYVAPVVAEIDLSTTNLDMGDFDDE
jgi:hypothetical protein